MSIRSEVRPSCPNSLPGLVIELLDDLTAAKHAPLESNRFSRVVAQRCKCRSTSAIVLSASRGRGRERVICSARTAHVLDGSVGNAFLEVHLAVDVPGLPALVALGIRAARRDAEAWGVERCLHAEAAENVQEDLYVSLRLWGCGCGHGVECGQYRYIGMTLVSACQDKRTCMKPPMTP